MADSADNDILALLGKKQVLKRRFAFPSLFAFAVCELITWENRPWPFSPKPSRMADPREHCTDLSSLGARRCRCIP